VKALPFSIVGYIGIRNIECCAFAVDVILYFVDALCVVASMVLHSCSPQIFVHTVHICILQ